MIWEELSIGDACFVGDGTHGKVKRQETGVLYLSTKNFKPGGLSLAKVDFISESDFAKHFASSGKAVKRPRVGDVLMGIIGSFGRPYLVRETDHFGISSSVAIVRADVARLLPEYLQVWMRCHEFTTSVESIKSGSAQGFLSLAMIRALPLRLPPLPTQRRIAGILSAYDDLIENNTKRIKILEEMARALYREWFVHFRFPGHEKVKLVDSPLGQIPEGWDIMSLKDICQRIVDTEHKTAPTQPTGYPSIRTPNVGLGRLLLDDVRRVSDETYREWTRREVPRPGDLILAREAPVGNVAVIPEGQQVCLGQRTVLLRPTPDIIGPHCLVRILLGTQVQDTIAGIASGATVPHLNMRDIRALRIPVPQPAIRDLAESKLRSIDQLIGILMAMSSVLRETRDLLLPRLISGELDVTNLDLPEVA